MTQAAASSIAAQGDALLNYSKRNTIPYKAGGMSLTGMDCQGLVEFLLIQAGVPKGECNLAGSNAHYRACRWTGTPEECKALFGEIPGGAFLFILEQDGNEPAKYKADGIGNASHMGFWTGKVSLAASASRGESDPEQFQREIHQRGLEPCWAEPVDDLHGESGGSTGGIARRPRRTIPAIQILDHSRCSAWYSARGTPATAGSTATRVTV